MKTPHASHPARLRRSLAPASAIALAAALPLAALASPTLPAATSALPTPAAPARSAPAAPAPAVTAPSAIDPTPLAPPADSVPDAASTNAVLPGPDSAPALAPQTVPLAGLTPPPAPSPIPSSAAGPFPTDPSLAKFLQQPSGGKPIVTQSDPLGSRVGATVPLLGDLSFEAAKTSFDPLHRSSLGEARFFADSAPAAGNANLLDATLRFDLAHVGPVTLSALGGMRATMLDASWYVDSADGSRRDRDRILALPVAGGSLEWRFAPRAALRGSGVSSTSDSGEFTDFRIESVFNLNAATEFSVGFERLKNAVGEDTALGASLSRNAVMFQLRFGF